MKCYLPNRHKLIDILVIPICGADGWEEFEFSAHCKFEWFKSFLELPHGIPSDDTFRRVIGRIDLRQFRDCFLEWVRSVAEIARGQVVAIDGKLSRGSRERRVGKSAINRVSARASENRLVLGQIKAEEKSNEITAIPQLLDILEIAGCIVTIDAWGAKLRLQKRWWKKRQITSLQQVAPFGQRSETMNLRTTSGSAKYLIASIRVCGKLFSCFSIL